MERYVVSEVVRHMHTDSRPILVHRQFGATRLLIVTQWFLKAFFIFQLTKIMFNNGMEHTILQGFTAKKKKHFNLCRSNLKKLDLNL